VTADGIGVPSRSSGTIAMDVAIEEPDFRWRSVTVLLMHAPRTSRLTGWNIARKISR
jgi:hypothetical protein